MSSATEFPEIHWEKLREAMETGGPAAVNAFIGGFDEVERLKLYLFAQRAFGGREWKGKNFDDYIVVANSGISEALRQSESATTPEKAAERKDTANVMSYNLTADLAECWPGDDAPREHRHFEAGLLAADNCIRWRNELGKTSDKKSMAEWAQGMHRMSLRDFTGAIASFNAAAGHAAEHAAANGQASSPGPTASFDVNLNTGYLGLAEIASGNQSGRARYAAVCDAFRAQAAQEENREMKENAQFGLEQLGVVEKKFAG
jgi:hypothetical protein